MNSERFHRNSAAVISVGDEILLGQTVDSNSAYIARSLSAIGVLVGEMKTTPDRAESIIVAVKETVGKYGVIVVTGGLGPTSDDLTRPALAKYFGRELVFREDLLKKIEERFSSRGVKMPETVKVQAYFPSGAEAIPNQYGTAPGILFREGEVLLFAVPGVPREMQGMVDDFIVPLLLKEQRGRPFRFRVIRTAGAGESVLSERIGDFPFPDVGLAYLPKYGCVDLRISALGMNEREVEARLDLAEVYIESVAGDYIYGYGETELAEAAGDLLRERGWKLAVAESCTGGLLGGMITDIPGSSDYFAGGFIVYCNEMKISQLGVPEAIIAEFGAVSLETAVRLAEGAAARAGVEVGIGVTGIAGPAGGTAEKPVGTVYIAVALPGRTEVERFNFRDDRIMNRKRSAFAALNMLYRTLQTVSE